MNLCIGFIDEPFHGFSKLLQVPSAVLYLLEAGGHFGSPVNGHSACSNLDCADDKKLSAWRFNFEENLKRTIHLFNINNYIIKFIKRNLLFHDFFTGF